MLQNIIIFFVFGSFIGWCLEVLDWFLKTKKTKIKRKAKIKIRRFMIGPYRPIYGLGFVIIFFVLSIEIGILWRVFIALSSVVVLELVLGLFYIRIGIPLWDYTNSRYKNYKGIVSISSSAFWLLGIIAFYYFIFLNLDKFLNFILDNNLLNIINSLCVVIAVDFIVSFYRAKKKFK
ncbi:MAG: hypothetical protein KAR54_00715 [Candidatus Pacebacteria bacterium]|nr:hypothetical protein [Candidatus Paceibacterota bacterium]